VRVCVVTTSYPRSPADIAGIFVAEQVAALRGAGVGVEVVSPASVRHYGIAYGDGIVQNLRARPWLIAAAPLFLLGLARAARRASRGADVVHAHWLPSALPALATGKPLVLQLWGTDVELARRAPWLARPLVRRARLVVAGSAFLARAAGELGANDVRVIASPVEIPAAVAPPEEPPHVLFAGRLSEEKGITDFLAATEGLPRLIVGDGPLRAQVPEATGFVPHERLGEYYARAAVVCVPSRREGYGKVAREAMAYGRPVVSTGVDGLADAIEDGVNGLVVPPCEPAALRESIERLLGDEALRSQLGANARVRAEESYSPTAATDALLAVYGTSVRRTT
jgi:glycosyltransferase involved in cell wall biosynthesis